LYERLLQESSDQARKSKIYFSPLFFYVGSEIRDDKKGRIRDPDPGSGSGIRDKHPGSATLDPGKNYFGSRILGVKKAPDPDLQH
jgi:hypothetical protein